MHETSFSVPVRDLERSDQRRSWEISPAWLDHALAESDARSDGKPGSLELYLKKTGREILVKGHARATVNMPCARTLEPVAVALDAEILLYLSPRATPTPGSTRPAPGSARAVAGSARPAPAAAPAAPVATRPAPGSPARRTRGVGGAHGSASSGMASGSDDGPSELLSSEEAARDEYSGDSVDLDAFVREHLLLELPLFPVRSDLRFELNAATNTPPDDSGAAPDPRLAPLAALASQLKKTGKLPKSS